MWETAAAAVVLTFVCLISRRGCSSCLLMGGYVNQPLGASILSLSCHVLMVCLCKPKTNKKREDPLLCCTNSHSWSDELAGYRLSLRVSVMFQLLLLDFLQRPTCLDGSIISGSLMWENNKNIGDFLHMLAPMSQTNNESTNRKSGWYDYKQWSPDKCF